MAEFMFLGLRMTKGISKADFQRCFGCTIESVYGEVLEKYESMELLLEKDGRIFLSREGIHVSNSIMAEFLLINSLTNKCSYIILGTEFGNEVVNEIL